VRDIYVPLQIPYTVCLVVSRIEQYREWKRMTEKIHGYTRDDLLAMNVDALRAVLHERTHHTIEVQLYRILQGRMAKPTNFGSHAKFVLEVWRARALPIDTPDLQWCIQLIAIADRLNAGRPVHLETEVPKPFSDTELETVRKLLFGRRSIRQFTDQPVPDAMVREILLAGLMAPQGCNVGSTRFIVLRRPEEWRLVRSDIPLDHGVMILIGQDLRVYQALRFDQLVPQNLYYDAAAAADHMCLMAHALGLGACWLTHGEETQQRIRAAFGLPATFFTRCHLIIGWPDEAPIKSQRMSLDDAIIEKAA
jgi:nitroreductase